MSNSHDQATECPGGQSLLGEDDISNKLRRLAAQIAEMHPDGVLSFVGIHTRGVTVAERVKAILLEMDREVQIGTLDISFYRDDLDHRVTNPTVQASEIPFEIEGSRIVIFDDVLYTGRTIRSAIEGVSKYGRPSKVELAVLIDRGNRELPIQPDYVGHVVDTERLDRIKVCFKEQDGEDSISLIPGT
ncbi:MAG: bifunctional pyr operon transcriptional regulator/uracil phosphoribosyltransferase PyrR [Verrucomicrobiales bacterium]|nr:bifunctional pyr operon transcriptional regulator/uracil phosphoribosyltransferase PyrR [Verrucomicrobiales bacterium]